MPYTPFEDANAVELDSQANNTQTPLSLVQLDRGNFKQGHIKLHGLDLSIRFARGTYGQTVSLLGSRVKINPVSHFAVCSKQVTYQGDQATPVLFGLRRAFDTVFAVPVTVASRRLFVLVIGADDVDDAKGIVTTVFWGASDLAVGAAVALWPDAVKAWAHGGFDPLMMPVNKPDVLLDLVQRNDFLLSDLWMNRAEQAASKVLYTLQKYDNSGQMFEALALDEACKMTEGEGATGVAMDSTTVTYKRLDKLNAVLAKAMNTVGGELQIVGAAATTEPKMKNGVLHVASQFALSDGQSITVWMHNIDATPKKINPDDELTAWKYLLNKKDITVVVAPEGGQDLTMREVATRVMRLAAKNSAAFVRAQAKQETLKATDAQLDADIAAADATIADLQSQIDARAQQQAAEPEQDVTQQEADDWNVGDEIPFEGEYMDAPYNGVIKYQISKPRRGAKGILVQRVTKLQKGAWKPRIDRLCEAKGISGRWAHVQAGYVIATEKKVEKLIDLLNTGWDASPLTGELIAPTDAPKPVVKVSANSDILPLDRSMAEILTAAQDNAKNTFANQSVTVESTGDVVILAWQGIKHGLSNGAGLIDALASTCLPDLVRTAQYAELLKPKHSDKPDVLATHLYTSRFEHDGKTEDVGIVVREYKDGRRMYDHFELKPKKTTASTSGGTSSEEGLPDPALAVVSDPSIADPAPTASAPQDNPDMTYLRSIIDGGVDLSTGEVVEDALNDIAERLTPEIEPLFEQAVDVYAAYQTKQAAGI